MWTTNACDLADMTPGIFRDEVRCQAIRRKVGEPCSVIIAGISASRPRRPVIQTLRELMRATPDQMKADRATVAEAPWYLGIEPPLEIIHEVSGGRLECLELDTLEVASSVVVGLYVRATARQLAPLKGASLLLRRVET